MGKGTVKEARLLCGRYGQFRRGDTIKGDLAQVLVDQGLAKDQTPSPNRAKAKKAKAAEAKAKRKPSTKAETGAPENKGDGFDAET